MRDLEARLRELRPVPPLSPPPWGNEVQATPSPKRRFLWVGLAAAGFLAVWGLVLVAPPQLPPVEGPGGPIAGKSQERPAPVRKVDLRRLGTWRALPFEISPEEEKALEGCRALASKAGHTVDGVNQFTLPTVREALEALLRERPRFFYAEHLLGLWFEMNGREPESLDYRQKALEHAPVVLVQTFLRPDGTPRAGLLLHYISVECNRATGGELLPSVDLGFPRLRTNAKGQVLVPVYDTVYRWSGNPTGLSSPPPGLGWFESPGKTGMLPPITFRERDDK